MYITGTRFDYATRLHELPVMIPDSVTGSANKLATGSADMQRFITEGKGYFTLFGVGTGLGQINVNESGKWEKEARQNMFMLSGNVTGLKQQIF